MKFFRTHITRSFNLSLLLIGLVFYFLKPVSEHASQDAFTIWLQSNLKSGENTSVLSEIKSLHSANGEMESIIREASALV